MEQGPTGRVQGPRQAQNARGISGTLLPPERAPEMQRGFGDLRRQVHDHLESRADPALPSYTSAQLPSAMAAEVDFSPGIGQG
eukprot:2836995-Pyramimonas_sp.AAC.1